MNNEELILKELKGIKQDVSSLKQGQVTLDTKVSKISDNLADFREEVKEGQDYTRRTINDGFQQIAEQMNKLFAHEKRITNLEHNMTKMSVLAPEHFKVKIER